MKIIFFIASSIFSLSLFAQYDCSSGRYSTRNFFSGFDQTLDIEFGENISASGATTQKLYMDVFEPAGDTEAKRPLVIMAFGGSFINGQRQDLHEVTKELAKGGYVAATVDYRIPVQGVDQVAITLAVLRGMHDIKAAVRYFYKDVITNGNSFRIDTNNIFIGGGSSGAISAVHAAYFDKDSETPAYMHNDTAGLGGIEGNSGNAGYSSKIHGVLNYSGTIGDTSWIEAGDAPILSMHDDGDDVVPYDTREIKLGPIPSGLVTSGSRDIHARINNLGIKNDLHTVQNSPKHVSYIKDDFEFTIDFTVDFLSSLFCGTASSTAEINSSTPDFEIYPNPAKNQFTIALQNIPEEKNKIELLDITGKVIETHSSYSSNQLTTINKSDLKSGIYFVRLTNKNTSITRKVTLL